MTRRGIYRFVSAFAVTAYAWIFVQAFGSSLDPGVCLYREVLGFSCPSCGITRATLLLGHGDVAGAVSTNPLALPALLLLLVATVLLLSDLFLRRNDLERTFRSGERLLRRKFLAIPLIVLVTASWIWTIYQNP